MLKIINEKDKLTAVIDGEIDHHSAAAIRAQLDSAVERSFPKKLILDFGGVTFMDSSGIGLILGRYKLISSMSGELVITNATEETARLIRMGGLEQIVSIEEAEEIK